MARPRSVFFGTPAFAVPALRALHGLSDIAAVVCQPDRRGGRGLRLQAPAVKQAASELGLPVHQPSKVRTGALEAWLREQRAEVAVVAAYGRILTPGVLAAPRLGCLNLHASLLPRHRGAAPVQWAILSGDAHSGISLMQMDEGLDTGPVFTRHRCEIHGDDTGETLAERLALLAAKVLQDDLDAVLCGRLQARPQPDEGMTLAPPIGPGDCRLRWDAAPHRIVARVRAMSPRPGAFGYVDGKRLRVLQARALAGSPSTGGSALPGTILGVAPGEVPGFAVAAGDGGWVAVERGQLEGRRVQSGGDLFNGRAVRVGQRLRAND